MIIYYRTAGVCLLMFAGMALAAGTYNVPMGDVPDITPQLRIERPAGVVRVGSPVAVRIAYEDFDAQPSLRCNPASTCTGSLPATVTPGPSGSVAQGHVHVYFQKVSAGFPDTQAVSFCIPSTVELSGDGYSGTLSGNCSALAERGVYRVSAEFQSNAHISSLKRNNSPQHVPTADAQLIMAR